MSTKVTERYFSKKTPSFYVFLLTACVPVRSDGLWRAGKVEYDELGLVRLAYDDLVEPDRGVHPADVGRVVTAAKNDEHGLTCVRRLFVHVGKVPTRINIITGKGK